MDPVGNPFAPGAGTPPPELAGRDDMREQVRIALERTRRGLPVRSVLMVGLRGVGKTVLLDRMRDDAEGAGIHTMRVEAPEERSLPALLARNCVRRSSDSRGTKGRRRPARKPCGRSRVSRVRSR